MAGTTRLELATSAVTGQRSNQLNYVPAMLRATGGGGFESEPSQCNQFMTTISRSRKVDNRSSIRRRRSGSAGRMKSAPRRRQRVFRRSGHGRPYPGGAAEQMSPRSNYRAIA